jgi:hypothetical protein
MNKAFMAATLVAGLASLTAPAFAQDHRDNENRRTYFMDGDRDAVRSYYHQTYNDGCPPGLTRTGDDCLSQGQARRRWELNQRLDRQVVIAPVPVELQRRLSRPRYGYRYGMVDGDIVQYDPKSRLVYDAIRAIVH